MCVIQLRGGRERGKNKLPTIIFCPFFDNRQNLTKKAMYPKKVGVTDLFKPQNPGEVVILAKSAYKSPLCVCSVNDVAPLRHEFACAVGMRKNN